jgi:hypothetical protein
MMTLLCKVGFHLWKTNGVWAGRKCQFCHQVEVLYYDKETGEQWIRVS